MTAVSAGTPLPSSIAPLAGVDMNAKHTQISPLMAALSAYIAGAVTRSLPDNVIDRAKAHLLDTIATMVSGSRLPPRPTALAGS